MNHTTDVAVAAVSLVAAACAAIRTFPSDGGELPVAPDTPVSGRAFGIVAN